MKVRIKSLGLSKAAYGQQANYGLSLSSPGSASAIRSSEHMMKPGLKPKKTITGVDRDKATLEAEGGETVVGQISGDGIVDHMTIKGPRHSDGGVPLDLPEDSFIFSDTRAMKINDPNILQMFGKKPKKGGYTPAELAKPYDISKYKAILMDPDTDRLSRNTAEIMIKNIVMKLGALALAQEAKKGFPQGIPEIAKPYMAANGISEEDLMPELKAQAEQMQAMQQQQAMQMQQAQAMQQPQMQQQGPPQGMPPMMPSGQPAAMPQQGMAPPQQPMMDPRQMMAMQQEQQMMPPQPQQGMPMADVGIQQDENLPIIDGVRPYTLEEDDLHDSIKVYKDGLFKQNNRIFKDVFQSKEPIEDKVIEESKVSLPSYPVGSYDQKMKILTDLQQGAASEASHAIDNDYRNRLQIIQPRVMQSRLIKQMHGGTPMAAYGMQLGGYDMPFIMGTGGVPRYDHGGPHPETVENREAFEVEVFSPGGRENTTDQSGFEARTFETPGAEEGSANYYSGGRGTEAGVASGICKKIRESNNLQELFYIEGGNPPFPAYLKPRGITPADPGFDDAIAAAIEKLKANPLYTDCIQGVQDATAPTIRDEYIIPADDEEVEYCYCRDKDGNAIEGTKILRSELGEDEDGNLIECESIEFKEKYCTETYDEIIEEDLEEEEGILPLPLMPAFKSRVPGQDKTPPPLRGRLDLALDDYRTALQTDQGMLEKNVEAIRNSNMPYGMKAAAIAQVMSQSKGSEIVSGVYGDNVNRMNDLYAKEAGLEQTYDQLRYQGDLAYDQAEGQRRQQQLATDNAQAQYRSDYAKDVWKTQLMAGAIGTENYDWRSRFRRSDRRFDPASGTMNYTDYKASYCDGKTEAECRAAFQAEMSGGDPNVAKYGKVVTPYVMASSVYPFLI